ncbi:MAG: alpha/beta fold hydrolase [Verrucomicrobiota bacterium]
MPLLTSCYAAPRWLRGGHVQTILPVFLPRRFRAWDRQDRLELKDGDFLELRWMQAQGSEARPLALLSHGLEGSVEAIYIRSMARTLAAAGWDVLAWNYRGCGGIENRLRRFYHSGESADLHFVIEHAASSYARIALVGFSLGANLSLKAVGERAPHPSIRAVIGISGPVDLASSAVAIDQKPANRVYQKRFLQSLKDKVVAKSARYPELHEMLAGNDGIRAVTTLKEFDERITAPLHGFADAEDYWAKASSLPYLPNIRVPALLLSARNDPLLTAASFPEELARSSEHLHLEAPMNGGHVGFHDFRAGLQPWSERRVLEFLSSVM